MKTFKTKIIHRDDKSIMIRFIDNVRLRQKENVSLEIMARHLATHLKVNPNVSNARLASKFATLLETKQVK